MINQIQQRNIAGRIHRFSRILSSLSEHRWATDGYPEVRSGHVQLLSNVDPEGTRNTVLALRAQITKQTMGRLVRELTESGYVIILPDPIDKRAQQVQLTERGKAFLSYLSATLIELETAFRNAVGVDKWSAFTTTFTELLAFVESRQQELSR